MDRGDVDYKRLFAMHNTGAFFLIRAKSNTLYKRLYSDKTDNSANREKDLYSLSTSATLGKMLRYSYEKTNQLFDQQFYNSSSNHS